MHLKFAVAPALVCVLAVAGCGSSGGAAKQKSASGSFLAFSQCMRSHGVSNFPDPGPGGGIQINSTINPAAPSFRSAKSSCNHLLPGGGPSDTKPSKQQIAQEVSISDCMRKHGVTGFPDPTVSSTPGSPPDSNPNNYSLIEDRGGLVLAVPKTIDVTSPVFKTAASICHFS
jgi:hypothetical protein